MPPPIGFIRFYTLYYVEHINKYSDFIFKPQILSKNYVYWRSDIKKPPRRCVGGYRDLYLSPLFTSESKNVNHNKIQFL